MLWHQFLQGRQLSGSVIQHTIIRLTSSMLCGQAVKIKEDVSPQYLLNFQDGQKMKDTSTAILPGAGDSTVQKSGNAEQTSTENSVMHAELLTAVMKNDIVESLKAPGPSSKTVRSIVKNGVVARPPLEERALGWVRKSNQRYSVQFLSGACPVDCAYLSALVEICHISNKTESGTLGGHMIGLGNGGTVFPPLSAAIQSEFYPHSVDLFGKLKGAKDLPPSSPFSPRTVDEFPPCLLDQAME